MSLISHFFNVVITYPIFNVLMLLYHLFGDFGLSIIVLTLAITALLLLSARGRDHKAEEHNAIEEKQPQSLVDRSCLRSNCIPGKLSQPIQRQVGSDVLQNIR